MSQLDTNLTGLVVLRKNESQKSVEIVVVTFSQFQYYNVYIIFLQSYLQLKYVSWCWCYECFLFCQVLFLNECFVDDCLQTKFYVEQAAILYLNKALGDSIYPLNLSYFELCISILGL